MTHYDVLGVRPGATTAEIRSAYVAKARRAHPDVAGAAGDSLMRDLNSAWSVLGNVRSRAAYDRSIASAAPQPEPSRSNVNRPAERPFVPYHPVDEDDDDEWRYVDDVTDPETAPGAALQLGPIVIVGVGVAVVVAGAVLRAAPIAALGAVLALLGAVTFLIVPLMVMAKASTVEHRRQRERDERRR